MQNAESKNSIKVSVIVPVYNAEKNIRTCVDSILAQSLKNIEVIFVDDGSTDASREILREYEEKDARVSVFFQENQYAGVARNHGMSHAKGKYLAFWDSDDYFKEDALELMYAQCEKDEADVCVCNARQYLDDEKLEVPARGYLVKKYMPEAVPFSIKTNEYMLNFTAHVPWNKLYKREYIEGLGLKFQARRNVNDAYFVANALCRAERVTIVDKPLVVYRKNQQTNLVKTVHKSVLSPYEAWIDIHDALEAEGLLPKRSYDNKALETIVYFLHYTSTYEALKESVDFLKSEGLARMGLTRQEEGYYFSPWKKECLDHLLDDTVEEFLTFFMHGTYIQLYTSDSQRYLQEAELKTLRKQNEALDKKVNSASYKIGRVITFIPRKIKAIFSK